jgi:hypothetical protein
VIRTLAGTPDFELATVQAYCSGRMAKAPPIPELDFIKLTSNHAEFGSKLVKLAIASPEFREYAEHVCECWFRLAQEHLLEAQAANGASCGRTAYSRAYYAAYNASKAMRYMVNGAVSLRGDDHGRAAVDLPTDMVDMAAWSQNITILYEHRLRADYDNWQDSASQNTLSPVQAVQIADDFVKVAKGYLTQKFGMFL